MSLEAPSWAVEQLRVARVARLATKADDGQPHVVPVCFVFDGAALFTPIDGKPKRTRRLKRIRNIEANPRVALLVDHYEEDWSRLRYVLVEGEGSIVEGDNAMPALAALREKYPQYAEVELFPEVIRIDATRIVAWSASDDTN